MNKIYVLMYAYCDLWSDASICDLWSDASIACIVGYATTKEKAEEWKYSPNHQLDQLDQHMGMVYPIIVEAEEFHHTAKFFELGKFIR